MVVCVSQGLCRCRIAFQSGPLIKAYISVVTSILEIDRLKGTSFRHADHFGWRNCSKEIEIEEQISRCFRCRLQCRMINETWPRATIQGISTSSMSQLIVLVCLRYGPYYLHRYCRLCRLYRLTTNHIAIYLLKRWRHSSHTVAFGMYEPCKTRCPCTSDDSIRGMLPDRRSGIQIATI